MVPEFPSGHEVTWPPKHRREVHLAQVQAPTESPDGKRQIAPWPPLPSIGHWCNLWFCVVEEPHNHILPGRRICVKAEKGARLPTLGEAIRTLRKRLGWTTTRLGRELCVDNATISRYERGKLKPSSHILMGLYLRAGPDEKPVFAQELRPYFDRGFFGGPPEMTMEEVIEDLRSTWGEGRKGSVLMDLLAPTKRHDWGFRQFVVAVAHLIEVCETVDESIADMLQLWAAHRSRPETGQYFRDALGYLRARLWPPRQAQQDQDPVTDVKPGDPTGGQGSPTAG